MRTFFTLLAGLALLAILGLGGAWFMAGRAAGPTIQIRQPDKFIGRTSSLELVLEAPGGRFGMVDVRIEQAGTTLPVFSLTQPAQAEVTQESADRLYVIRPIGQTAVPQLTSGPARILVRATRPVLYGLRQAEATVAHDVQVRLDPPRVAVLSTKHYVNLGGSEMVVYTASPSDVQSGVRVGDIAYPGFPAAGAGIPGEGTKVAVFALLHDQDVNTPIVVFARDPAGNDASVPLDREAFPKPFAKSRIEVDDRFLARVVPAIVGNTPDLKLSAAPSDLVTSFLTINGDLRRKNAAVIEAITRKTAPTMMWKDAFQQLGNSQVESRFADHRTYFYQGKEIDQQVHLGFDLAVTANVPVSTAQRGIVVFADYLGIYGNCVIVDHGLGVQSLYAHLSSIGVKLGATVDKGQVLGRSGMTGLAGGDHLHFSMLVNGHPVTPVDWWDSKWMQDRILRKITEAGGTLNR